MSVHSIIPHLSPTTAAATAEGVMPVQEQLINEPGKLLLQHPSIQFKLSIGAVDDPLEREADTMADTIMRMPEQNFIQRKCSHCEEEEKIQRKPFASFIQRKESSSGAAASDAITSQINSNKGNGSSMDSNTQTFMQSRFGADFSDVKIHTSNQSTQLNRELGAKAFTVGNDIYFNEGQYNPGSHEGKHLLAHELTHTVQQAGNNNSINTRKIQRTEKPPDPLCADYLFTNKKTIIEGKIEDLKATPEIDKRLALVLELKWILRCGSEDEKKEITTKLEASLGKETSDSILVEASSPLGGYRGAYPAFYGGGKTHLKKIGVKEIEAYDAFSYTPKVSTDATFFKGREDTAKTEAPIITATDILYFYGHQYAQYGSPGVFANGTQTQFVDLTALTGKGDFSRVKLIISTSCATCCKEAVDTFSSVFPNAVILGYRKSAPIDGDSVRNSFDTGIQSLKRPLLLDQPVDINSIIDVWKTVMEKYHPKENIRLPGYYQGGTVNYLESGIWKSMPASDATNSCKKKGTTIDEASH